MHLDHVALTVRDRERSAAFYGEHFGLTARVHDDEHLLILADPAMRSLLALSAGDPGPRPPRTTHFGFRVPDAAAVRAARERFAADDVDETEWSPDGTVRVQVSDPDGYRVDVYAV